MSNLEFLPEALNSFLRDAFSVFTNLSENLIKTILMAAGIKREPSAGYSSFEFIGRWRMQLRRCQQFEKAVSVIFEDLVRILGT